MRHIPNCLRQIENYWDRIITKKFLQPLVTYNKFCKGFVDMSTNTKICQRDSKKDLSFQAKEYTVQIKSIIDSNSLLINFLRFYS